MQHVRTYYVAITWIPLITLIETDELQIESDRSSSFGHTNNDRWRWDRKSPAQNTVAPPLIAEAFKMSQNGSGLFLQEKKIH